VKQMKIPTIPVEFLSWATPLLFGFLMLYFGQLMSNLTVQMRKNTELIQKIALELAALKAEHVIYTKGCDKNGR